MASCDDVQRQLSLLVDGQLAADEEADVRRHLSTCASCRGVLADLERVRAAARSLGPIEPPEHVWLEVAGQIRLDGATSAPAMPRPPARASRWQWVGIAAALVLVTAGLYVARHLSTPPAAVETASNAPPAGTVESVEQELNMAASHYEKAIAELETMAKNGDNSLDPSLATVVHNNLGAIDQAIVESRTALTANPENDAARDSLFDALRRKIAVLQATVSLINDMRLGDQDGAARAAETLGKKS